MNIFDIVGPVMIGPSSSHTAGACRLGLLAAGILGERPQQAQRIETGRGSGRKIYVSSGGSGQYGASELCAVPADREKRECL